MSTSAKQVEKKFRIKRYKIQYPISSYTYPPQAQIGQVHFDEQFIHVGLVDGRLLSIPLQRIPTLYNAAPEEREKYEINPARTMIIWDPDRCAINDEISVSDYLGPLES